MKLTDQQQAIVEHGHGPALVFAVAGAGKTTCMVYRISLLIKGGKITPPQILATSFNNSAVADIVAQLQQLGVPTGPKGVDCRTLHSLGYRVIRSAVQRGHLERDWLQNVGTEDAGNRLMAQTLTRMAIEDGVDSAELGVDREDLKNQISIWKGNLAYADLSGADLSEAALTFATQATHPNPDYLRAYRIYEEIRRQRRLITFDDMLMLGWELLERHPALLHSAQSRYRSVIVDEFQDVNYSQYQMLDLLTRPHRNYMAIGDDDQCIYEWRGASPAFILNFEKNYGAQVYTISDNFRSSAHQILLANAVISLNQQRYPKFLSLTRGFKGETQLLALKDDWEIARSVAGTVSQRLDEGASTKDMVVLIRLYSQTAYIETAFMEKEIPYEIVGNDPFYKRSEVVPLFQYLSFAFVEAEIAANGFPEDSQQVKKYLEMFRSIANRPRRYLSRAVMEAATLTSRKTRQSIIEVLLAQREALPKRVRQKVEDFAETIRLLGLRLKRPAQKTLRWLIDTTDYKDYLINISGQYEIGLTRVQTVEALVAFAGLKKLRCREFLDHIRFISLNPLPNQRGLPPLPVMTVYKAKGLEWETVFVPGSYEGLAPCMVQGSDTSPETLARQLEAERRLYYVAITRARRTLYLYYPEEGGPSPFLEEVDAHARLKTIERLGSWLEQLPEMFSEDELRFLCQQLVEMNLERYFVNWNNALQERGEAIAASLQAVSKRLEEAEKAQAAYKQALATYQQENTRARQKVDEQGKRIYQTAVIIRKFKSSFYRMDTGQELRFEHFDDGNIIVLSEKGMVGVVDFDEMPRFDRAAVYWESSTVTVSRVISDVLLRARFITLKTDRRHLTAKLRGWRVPSPPSRNLQKWLLPELRKGVDILKKLL